MHIIVEEDKDDHSVCTLALQRDVKFVDQAIKYRRKSRLKQRGQKNWVWDKNIFLNLDLRPRAADLRITGMQIETWNWISSWRGRKIKDNLGQIWRIVTFKR